MVSSNRRKEQARESQRRSRAHRKAYVSVLETRVAKLLKALEEVTEASLQFSDVVMSSLRLNGDDISLRTGTQVFMHKVIAAARISEQDHSAGEGEYLSLNWDAVQPRYQTEDSSTDHRNILPAQTKSIDPATTSPNYDAVTGAMSPRLTYGIWPSLKHANTDPPKDISAYLQISAGHGIIFGTYLYWNTLCFAYGTLYNEESLLTARLFGYSLQFSSVSSLLGRLRYRIQYKPQEIDLCVPVPRGRKDSQKSSYWADMINESNYSDMESETQDIDQHRVLITQAMATTEENHVPYLSASDVEDYLRRLSPLLRPTNGVNELSSRSPAQVDTQGMQQIVQDLASQSRCLGNGIGYSINAVNEVASKFLHTIQHQ